MYWNLKLTNTRPRMYLKRGYFCSQMARWTAPYTDIKQWTSDGNSPLVQMLDAGDSNAVLNKIDY